MRSASRLVIRANRSFLSPTRRSKKSNRSWRKRVSLKPSTLSLEATPTMHSLRIIQGIDSHTAGCPLRLITSGFGPIRGTTMAEKRADLMTRDELRRLVLFEPRGSFNMPAAVLTEACSRNADIGMIILEPDTYPPMCGHCAMAVATIAV